MTRIQVRISVSRLRANGPYFVLGFRDCPEKLRCSTAAERLSLAYADPAYEFNVPSAYAAVQEELPDYDWPAEVLRFYEFLRGTNADDPDIQAVLQLNEPGQEDRRAVLRAGLLCFDTPLEELAARLFLRFGVVRTFELLCWNCRDRRRDMIYLSRLCRIRGFAYGGIPVGAAESSEGRLFRLALETGSLDQVLESASSGAVGRPYPTAAPAELELTVLREVLLRLKARQLSKQDNPWLEPVLASMGRRERERQLSPGGASGPTIAESISWTFSPLIPKEPIPCGENPSR